MKRMLLVTLATSALTTLVIGNAYLQKKQFYSTIVYLLNSNRTLGVLYVQAAVMVWVSTTIVKMVFFGTLRAAEVEHLVEKSWYMVLETFILLAGFHEDMQVGFVATITFLFVIKAFHWLIEERIDYMERSPLITWKFHLRAVSILFLLAVVDILYIRHSWNSLRTKGASVQIVFGLEYTIMLLVATNTFLHYLLHSIDLRSEDPWENKTIYMRYVDIGVGFMKLCLYMSYMVFMMWILFVPLHIARRIFITAKHFQKSVNDVLSSHQAIRNLNTLYPDATDEELRAASTVCIICREDMLQRCKKLPCKHIFHTSCLRSWFQRQQNCPTCRMDVLSHSAAQRRNGRQQQGQRPRMPPGGVPPGPHPPPPPPGLFNPMMPHPPMGHMWPPPPPPPGMVPPQPPNPPAAEGPNNRPPAGGNGQGGQGGATQGDNRESEGTIREDGASTQSQSQAASSPHPPPPPQHPVGFPGFSPFPMMPPPFMAPGMMQPPPPPPPPPPSFNGMPSGGSSLEGLTDEQLRSLEGMERGNVEARIAVLRNIQRLLDTAVTQMTQYSVVMASMGSVAGPGFPGHPYPPGATPATTGQDSPPPPPSNTTASSSTTTSTSAAGVPSPPRPLVDGERVYSFSARQLHQQRSGEDEEEGRQEEEEERESTGERGLFTVGETEGGGGEGGDGGGERGESGEQRTSKEGSPSAMNELRQRRLQRFHSVPAVSSATDSTLAEKEGNSSQSSSSTKEQ